MKFLRKLLAGAFPEEAQQSLPQETQFPEDGLIKAPSTLYGDFGSAGPDPVFVPICTLLARQGQRIPAGFSIAEIETSTHIIEIPAPCDLCVDELLFSSGDAILPDQPIAQVSRA